MHFSRSTGQRHERIADSFYHIRLLDRIFQREVQVTEIIAAEERQLALIGGKIAKIPAKKRQRVVRLMGRDTVDLKISRPLKLGNRLAELFVSIKNLLDNDFESHYGYPDDGLRGLVGVNMTF